MRPILDDDDDDQDRCLENLPEVSEKDSVPGELAAGVSLPRDNASESAASESDNESDDRQRSYANPHGECLGKGFHPYFIPVDNLVKKLERRKAAWQKKQIDIDATIDSAMYQNASLMGHDAVLIEEEEDNNDGEGGEQEGACCDADGKNEKSLPAAVPTDGAESQGKCANQLQGPSPELHGPLLDADESSTIFARDKVTHKQQIPGESGKTGPSANMCRSHLESSGGSVEATGFAVALHMPMRVEDPLVAQVAVDKVREARVLKEDLHGLECDVIVKEVRHRGRGDAVRHSIPNGTQVQEHLEHSTHENSEQVQEDGDDHHMCANVCTHLDSSERIDEEEASQLDHGRSHEDSEVDKDPSEIDFHGLEDSDVEPLSEDAADEDDEEAMLEAAIMEERRAQQLLGAKQTRGNHFCDGEAEQSEDEAVSSDESDVGDENGGLSVEEIADMMRELREKGLGEAEVADAHAKWLEEEDDKALQNLVHSIKKGFRKGRKRVVEDMEEWDVDEARERRRALLPKVTNQLGISQTKDEVMLQYKRKLAALERSLESPVKPASKSLQTEEHAAQHLAGVENVVLPEIDDTDDSPRSQRGQPWATLINAQAGVLLPNPLTKPESQSWDAGDVLGPSLMGKNRKGCHSASIKSTSKTFMACTLGTTSSRTGTSAAAATAVQGPSASTPACQSTDQATFTRIREALGMQECER